MGLPPPAYWLLPLTGIAGYIAAFHLWLWTGRRRENLHLWVAGWCVDTMLYLSCSLLQLSAASTERAVAAGRLAWISTLVLPPLCVGLSHALAGGRPPRAVLLLTGVASGVTASIVWFTDALVTNRPHERIDVLGNRYIGAAPGPFLLTLIPYVALVLMYCARIVRGARTLNRRERRALLTGFVAYCGLAMHDLLSIGHVIQSVRLFDFGFVTVAIGLTYVVVHRYQREAEVRYRRLFERNLAGVLIADRSGRIIDSNDSMAHLLGYESRDELMRHNAREFYVDPNARDVLLADLTPDGPVSGREQRWKRHDGTTVWLRSNVRATDGGLVEGILIDISDTKRLEETEREAAELRAIAKLAAAAAHEINNPLTILAGQLSILKDEQMAHPRIDSALRAVNRVSEIVGRMGRITRVAMFEHPSPNLPPMIDIKKSGDAV